MFHSRDEAHVQQNAANLTYRFLFCNIPQHSLFNHPNIPRFQPMAGFLLTYCMRVAIPLFKNGMSPRLDITDSLLVYDIENDVVKKKEQCDLVFEQPAQLISFLQKKQVSTIACGGCPQFILRMLVFYGFDVVPGLVGDPESIVTMLINGKLNHSSSCARIPSGFSRQCRDRKRFRRGNGK